MDEIVSIALYGALAFGVLCWPVLHMWRPRRRKKFSPQPYLGEFVPAETDFQRADRERMAAWRILMQKVQLG